jgi:hypothetical protein
VQFIIIMIIIIVHHHQVDVQFGAAGKGEVEIKANAFKVNLDSAVVEVVCTDKNKRLVAQGSVTLLAVR